MIDPALLANRQRAAVNHEYHGTSTGRCDVPLSLPTMSGVQGVPTSVSNAVGAARANGSLSVDPEALLRASNILRLESEDLLREVNNLQGSVTVPCGNDPVSGPAADAFQAKITELMNQTKAYATNLGTAADTLRDQANQYGATDQQAKQALEQAQRERADYQDRLLAPKPRPLANPVPDAMNDLFPGRGSSPR